MAKVIYVDVGTHFAQEYLSIFGSSKNFAIAVARRLVGFHIFRRGEMVSLADLMEIIRLRYSLRKMRHSLLSFFVEANPNVIKQASGYKHADGVFNFALTGEGQCSLVKLYISNGDQLGQGSSIFLHKSSVSEAGAVLTFGVPSDSFFQSLKVFIENSVDHYSVILRLNCEGVEDDVIYSAHKAFSNNLKLVMGSLKDVEELKGASAFLQLNEYLAFNNLPFTFFSSNINSWHLAYKSIHEIFKNNLQRIAP